MLTQDICIHEGCKGKSLVISDDPDGHDDESCGSREAYLLMFDTPAKTAYEASCELNRGNVDNVEIQRISYCWDEWDFDKGMGYTSVLGKESVHINVKTIWLCTSDYHVKKYGRKGPFWVLNICPLCYKNFIDRKIVDPLALCSDYYHTLAERHKMPNQTGKIKNNVYSYIWKKYNWLRRLTNDLL